MAVSLSKGGNVNLTKEAGGTLTEVLVGLGWDAKSGNVSGAEFDLDASAFILGASGKVRTDADMVFFNNKTGANGAVEHTGDNLTGQGDGDDEVIKVHLANMPADVDKVIFTVTIFDADSRNQNFGGVVNSYVRVVNAADGSEIARYDLREDGSGQTAVVFGELYRNGPDWKFRAIGDGYPNGLKGLALDYGVNV